MEIVTNQSIIAKVEKEARSINAKLDPDKGRYKIGITQSVVDAINEMATGMGLSEKETEILTISAWFQSMPDVSNDPAELAVKFLKENNCDDNYITLVQQSILAAEEVFNPTTDLHRVIKDAFNQYLSNHSFTERMGFVREEKEAGDEKFTDIEWLEFSEKFLLTHQYYTEYALEHFEKGREKNLKKVRSRIKKLLKKRDLLIEKELQIDEGTLKEMKKKLVKASGRPERGIETLFRLTSKNHYTLNSAVDTKSNILISINSIILSIVLGTMLGKIEEDPHLLVPIIMLSVTNLWAIALAVFATRPVMTHGKFSMEDVKKGNTNLLFYGNFHQMPVNEYLEGLGRLMSESSSLYDSLGKDIYFMGIELNKKFTYLRRSFNIFIIGFIASVVVFIGCHLFFGQNPVFSF